MMLIDITGKSHGHSSPCTPSQGSHQLRHEYLITAMQLMIHQFQVRLFILMNETDPVDISRTPAMPTTGPFGLV